jgi:gliding motility-associated-like protein
MKALRYFFLFLSVTLSAVVHAQRNTGAVPQGMVVKERNYSTFTEDRILVSEEASAANAAVGTHPELGMLFPDAPCSNCYEVIGERTEFSKKFVLEGTNGRDVALQTATEAMHYRDAAGNWRTTDARLKPMDHEIYAAFGQPVPVSVNTRRHSVELGRSAAFIRFNNRLELIYKSADGNEKSLGEARWKDVTIGDDGMYVTDAWPGIDMEVYAARGAVKTNFHVKHALRQYAAGQLLLRDHVEMAEGLQLYAPDTTDWRGNMEVRNGAGKAIYNIGAATAYEQRDATNTLQFIGYTIRGNVLDIVVPGALLGKGAAAYPLVIDPLISTATASTVGGSSYSPTKTIGCNYVNVATVPAAVTVTDIRWSFNYLASGGALLLNGGVDFALGTCRSPGVGGLFWYCNLASAGTCTGSNISIMSDIGPCVPAPQCLSYNMNLNMRFYQNFAATTPCATTYITASTPLSVTVFGRTLETAAVAAGGGLTSVCLGQTVSLSTAPSYGVPPYTYSWNPGAVAGNPLVIAPAGSTNYTVTVTDACGNTATANQNISVTPIAPNTGNSLVCVGGTTMLSNPTPGGTWSSASPATAVVGSATGIVTGVSAGTVLISYITAVGCYATSVVTVIPIPGAITGTATLCVGATTTLTDPMTGGAWSSGNTAVATVGVATGVVSGVSAGTAVINYATIPGCAATTVVTVYPNPVISGVTSTDPTTCGASDGSITLSGLVAGVVYTISYTHNSVPVIITLTATASGQLLLTGLSSGLYATIAVKSPEGCTGNWAGTVTLVDMGTPPVPVAGSNSPVCEGWILKLTASGGPGVTYNWTGPGGFTSTLQNPQIDPATTANAGVYTLTTTLLSCVSLPATVTVTVNPLPHISGFISSNPTTCGGTDGSVLLDGLNAGVAYTIGYTFNGTPNTVFATADAAGQVLISGLSAGTHTTIFVHVSSCVSNLVGPVVLVDPLPPPAPIIASNAPICQGLTLLLFGSDDVPEGAWKWEGPDGFASAAQNPVIPDVSPAAQGVYTLSYTLQNCTSVTTADIRLQPVIELTDVYADKYLINFGDSVRLHAAGANYYNWTPHNGTMMNYYIPEPFVKPRDSVAVYTVHGMNEWGCHDSANITIRVIFDEEEYIPTAFTPNGDGRNDIFRIGKMKYKKLIDFTIYNRWGQEVYHNPWDPNGGWDGTCNGKDQEVGTYFYSIILESASGKLRYYKGDVTLLR